jgi:hypothetical protein
MKVTRLLAIASILCATTAGLALPSQAAPFFNASSNAACAPGNHTSFNNGYHNGFNNSYHNGYVAPPVVSYNNHSRFGYNNIGVKESMISRQIQNGIANGSLTRAEADRLMSQQARVNQLQARLASNGLSFSERARLNADLARLEGEVRRQMSDRQTARRWW